jgi:enamine deaminase RidA (YjgF/YER057c/UK114 family)
MAVASGSRTVYLAGQVARAADGTPVGTGDFGAQVEQAYVNVGTALEAVGGTFADVAKLTVYVVDWSPELLPELGAGVARAAARLGVDPIKPVTLISVVGLGEPDLLVEVDAVAVLP